MRVRSPYRLWLLASLGGCLLSGAAIAGVPSPANSTIPCMAVCPFNDIPFTVVIRDFANNPIAGSSVVIDVSGCPEVKICGPGPWTDYTILDPTHFQKLTDATGTATFHLALEGVCAGGMGLSADGVGIVLPPNGFIANTDQNADGFVLANDQAIFVARGPTDRMADLNCDGVHDAADNGLFATHLAHLCRGLIDATRGSSWGRVKILYR